MSIPLSEQDRVLDAVDLALLCERSGRREHRAELVALCRGCRRGVLLCRHHRNQLRRRIRRMLRRSPGVTCCLCHRTSPTYADAVQAVDI